MLPFYAFLHPFLSGGSGYILKVDPYDIHTEILYQKSFKKAIFLF